jgi:hypothetical protein
VLLGEAFSNPDDSDGLQAGGIRKQLAEMGMVSTLELVFDQNPVARGGVLAQNVCAERANIFFLSLDLQVDAHGITQDGDISLLGKPRSEVPSFICPNFMEIYSFKATKRF